MSGDALDYGLYALRYHAREPQIYLRPSPPNIAPSEGRERPTAYGTAPGIFYGPSNPLQILYPGGFGAATGSVGSYNLVYPEGIEVYGASFSGYLGDANLAGEISARRRMPLISTALVIPPAASTYAPPSIPTAPLYARGSTLHAQMSLLTSFAATDVWEAASLAAEVAATHRLKVTRNSAVLDTTRDRSAAIVSAVFEPRYFAVLPGLDLGLPASIAYGLSGRSSVDGSQVAGSGSLSLGISATYRAVWNATFGITHFIGGATRQPFTDRDFIAFSLQRTF